MPAGPSPVSSRTRTSLKRSSSFACDDDSLKSYCVDNDRTSISLRKAIEKRKSRECPQPKKGKRENPVGSDAS
jgi:hypothetical protein